MYQTLYAVTLITNFSEIEQSAAELWRFNGWRFGGLPPFWIPRHLGADSVGVAIIFVGSVKLPEMLTTFFSFHPSHSMI